MAKYRKKPILVDAQQWFLGDQIDGIVFKEGDAFGFVDTLEGRMSIYSGDWIVTGIHGERYPVRKEIFEKTYEAIDANT